MVFRETLLKKIALDELVRTIRAFLEAHPDRVDAENLRRLLAESAYSPRSLRDLKLYVREEAGALPDVVVLDNGLSRYRTHPEDVALRKSPTIKEMISIRNARKILSDSDVLISRREKTLEYLHEHCIGLLDLSWTEKDISGLADDGAVALEIQDAEGVETVLLLFAELLGFSSPPGQWRKPEWFLRCLKEEEGEKIRVRNFLAFSRKECRLVLVEAPLYVGEKEADARVKAILSGTKREALEGKGVFASLQEKVGSPGNTGV